MAIKLRVECTDCKTVDDYEGLGCFVIIFNEDGSHRTFQHHANMQQVLPVAVRHTLRELVQQEVDFNRLIKGEG